jgi:hypothetical protein
MYFSVTRRSSVKRIDGLVCLNVILESVGYLLKQYLSIGLRVRALAHLFYEKECDEVYFNDGKYPNKYTIEKNDYVVFQLLKKSILEPLVNTLKSFVKSNSFSDYEIVSDSKVSFNLAQLKEDLNKSFNNSTLTLLLKLLENCIEVKHYTAAMTIYNHCLYFSKESQIFIHEVIAIQQKQIDEQLALAVLGKIIEDLLENNNDLQYQNWQQAILNYD